MALRFSAIRRSFDFAAIAAKLPAASVSQFNGLRVQHQALKSKLENTPESPAAIDFASYNLASKLLSDKVPKIKAMVDGAQPKRMELDFSAMDAQAKETEVKAAALIESSKAKLASLESELAALNSQAAITDMTTKSSSHTSQSSRRASRPSSTP